jgi:hypothetical protein
LTLSAQAGTVLTECGYSEGAGSMTDEEVEEWFFDAIEGLPAHKAEAAREWLVTREAAFQLVEQIEKGLSILQILSDRNDPVA